MGEVGEKGRRGEGVRGEALEKKVRIFNHK
jgi:hypothetical protein